MKNEYFVNFKGDTITIRIKANCFELDPDEKIVFWFNRIRICSILEKDIDSIFRTEKDGFLQVWGARV